MKSSIFYEKDSKHFRWDFCMTWKFVICHYFYVFLTHFTYSSFKILKINRIIEKLSVSKMVNCKKPMWNTRNWSIPKNGELRNGELWSGELRGPPVLGNLGVGLNFLDHEFKKLTFSSFLLDLNHMRLRLHAK